jgi:hypothetical protein
VNVVEKAIILKEMHATGTAYVAQNGSPKF